MAVPGTSVAGHSQSELDENMYKCQYSAPEIQWPEDYDMEKVLITKESDVYSLAMVAYEASFRRPVSSGSRANSHVNPLGPIGRSAIRQVQRS